MTTTLETSEVTADAFAEKLFTSFVASLETLGFYAGERLGWFQGPRRPGPGDVGRARRAHRHQ